MARIGSISYTREAKVAMQAIARKRKAEELALEVITKRKRPCSPASESNAPSDSHSSCSEHDESAPSTPLTAYTPSSPSKSKDPRPKKYHCPFAGCDKVFNRPVRLEEHIRSHTNTRPFVCPHAPACNKTFLRQTHLNHHIKSAHTDEREYVCTWPGCDKKFATGTRLRRHVEAHEAKDQFRCQGYQGCDKTFRKQTTLQRHIETEHLQLKSFRCTKIDEETNEVCDLGFDTAAKLRAHEGRNHGEILYLCSLCGTGRDGVENDQDARDASSTSIAEADDLPGFSTYADLQNHIKLEHPPQCPHCHLTVSTARELSRHIEIAHSGQTLSDRRTFLCTVPECGKGFTKKGNLNTHIRTVHKASAGKQSRKQQPSLIVSNDTPETRDISAVSKLTGHDYTIRSAVNGRTIACIAEACAYRFRRRYDLIKHAKKVHEMEAEDVEEALAEREALSGGKFWVGGDEEDETKAGMVGVGMDQEEEDWRDATGLWDVPGVDVRSGLEHGTNAETIDLQALVDFCVVPGNVIAEENVEAVAGNIDPALI